MGSASPYLPAWLSATTWLLSAAIDVAEGVWAIARTPATVSTSMAMKTTHRDLRPTCVMQKALKGGEGNQRTCTMLSDGRGQGGERCAPAGCTLSWQSSVPACDATQIELCAATSQV